MRGRRAGTAWPPAFGGMAVFVVLTSCRPPAPMDAASAPAGNVSAPAPSPAVIAAPEADSLPALAGVFEKGTLGTAWGSGTLREHVREVVLSFAESGQPGPFEVAFVVDRSEFNHAPSAVAVALAGARDVLPPGTRTALVTFAAARGTWVPRIEAPLGEDTIAVIRAGGAAPSARGGGGGARGCWAGLAEAIHLDWHVPPARRHVVLLCDDVPWMRVGLDDERPPEDPELRRAVAAWAKGASGRVLESKLQDKDGRAERDDEFADKGTPLPVVAGLVRDGHYANPKTPEALRAAFVEALDRATDQPADVALVLDRQGLVNDSLVSLHDLQKALDRFVSVPGHRLALLGWDRRGSHVVVGLTSRRGVVPAALRAMRASAHGKWPRDVWGGIAPALGLAWSATARKRVVVMTEVLTKPGPSTKEVLRWTDEASVGLDVIEPNGGSVSAHLARQKHPPRSDQR